MKSVLTVLTLLTLCAASHAQSCGTPCSYGRSYSHRSYTPSYSYSYAAPAKVVKKEVYHDYKDVEYKLVLPVFALQVFSLPTYGAAYAPPAQQTPPPPAQAPPQQQAPSQMQQILAAQTQTLEALKRLDDRLGKIEQRVERIERTRQPLPQPQQLPKQEAPKDDDLAKAFAAVNAASCAACHSRSNAAKHGGEFVFSEDDGRPARLTAEQREEVERQITSGKMPKLKSKRAEEAKVQPLTQQTADVLFRTLDRQRLEARKE